MPKLSDTMEEGKILRWLKHPGDEIHHGDQLAEVETDKADMVLEAFDDGVLDEVKLKEGESAKVGAVIATLRKAGEAPRPRPKLAAAPAKDTQAEAAQASAASQMARSHKNRPNEPRNTGRIFRRDGEPRQRHRCCRASIPR